MKALPVMVGVRSMSPWLQASPSLRGNFVSAPEGAVSSAPARGGCTLYKIQCPTVEDMVMGWGRGGAETHKSHRFNIGPLTNKAISCFCNAFGFGDKRDDGTWDPVSSSSLLFGCREIKYCAWATHIPLVCSCQVTRK